ncbi:hypothetical protein [Guptibacillus algicola]|uniref:hypothetical protein n=1 Tax=Guptibacillus algicola TaxID=225844 RepID=UPI001CD19E83|nr:hypothetical protein [Alkalihalobacillus algicola]MCA0986238.1 hypothetical protein [Alkalihalobacillus algicola]
MDITMVLQYKYGFEDMKWNHTNLIETHVGTKKVTYWRDRKLLEYHLNFRDRLFSKSGIMCNRMIRTRDGLPYVQIDQSFITVHDVIDSSSAIDDDPQFKGFLIASLLDISNELPYHNQKDRGVFPYKESIKALNNLKQKNERYYSLLVRAIPKVKQRLTHEKTLSPTCYVGNELNVINGQYYYNLSEEPPESAHQVIRKALDFERVEDIQACWASLLNAISKGLAKQVKGALISPWEWKECIDHMQCCRDEEEIYHRFEKEWEATMELCEALKLSVPARRTFSYE